MKRFICCVSVILFVFALAGCGKDTAALEPTFEGEIQATDGRVNYIAYCTADEDGVSVTLTAPESVAGIRYEVLGEELHTRLGKLDCITAADSLPPASFVSLLHEVFGRTGDEEYTGTVDGEHFYTLKTRGGTAQIAAKGGRIRHIGADYGNWSITIS